MKTLYKKLLDECQLLQTGCGQTELLCEEQTQQLLDDVSLGGQYLPYDPATNVFIERDINVYTKNKFIFTQQVTINGVSKPFNEFTDAEIISNWQNAWSDIFLPYHPEYCAIDDCTKDRDSKLWDLRFRNTENVNLAKSAGYFYGDNYFSVVDNDPYFLPAARASLKTEFINRLQYYKNTGTDIMNFVRWSLYCQSKGIDNPAITCARTAACNLEEEEWSLFRILYNSLKQEIINENAVCTSNLLFPDPIAQVTSGINGNATTQNACPNLAFFEISNSSGTITVTYTGTQTLTQAVKVHFIGIDNSNSILNDLSNFVVFSTGAVQNATQIKTGGQATLTYVINYARCDMTAGHEYYEKARRNHNGINTAGLVSAFNGKTPDNLDANAEKAMKAACSESCELSADGWLSKLEGCNIITNSAEYNQVRDGLIAVCQGSCNIDVKNHPFGASSTGTPTVYGDRNFKDVLWRVLGAARFNAVCNELLIDYPSVAGVKPLYTNEVVRKLEFCSYDKLKSWKAIYASTTGYAGFSDYVKQKIDPAFSLTDAEVNNLQSAYDNKCLAPKPILLPASLSCNSTHPAQIKTCLTCVELNDEKINFTAEYSYVQADHPDYYSLLAKYVNRKYTFNLSAVDVYTALEQCITRGTLNPFVDTVSCSQLTTAYTHFQRLKPDYFSNPNGNLNADSLYKIHLTIWLNTELKRSLSFQAYEAIAAKCSIVFNGPGTGGAICPGDSSHCAPQFITCCEPFTGIEKFKQVFTDSTNARLLAVYFALQRTQWCAPVNLPGIDYNLPYDSLVYYFNSFKLANGYNITVRPDSLISYTVDNSGTCTATTLNFILNPVDPNAQWYALCNKPAQPIMATDKNSCINEQVSIAAGNAHRDYLEYIVELKRDYRDAYYTKCLSITPQLKLEAIYNQPLEYHYTLYYYDQAGNLVKTIPPAGVQPVDAGTSGAARMQRVANYRLADKDYCYEYGDAAFLNGSSIIKVPQNAIVQHNTSPFTVEGFINFNTLAGKQILMTQVSDHGDGTIDGYQIYLENGRLQVKMWAHGEELWMQTLSKTVQYTYPYPYSSTMPPVIIRKKILVPVTRSVYRSVQAQITSDISGLISTGQWAHIVVQNTTD